MHLKLSGQSREEGIQGERKKLRVKEIERQADRQIDEQIDR